MHRSHTNRPRACDQARSLVSLRVDDELSELESALLEAHLAICRVCSAFADDVETMTARLRHEPLVRLDRPIALPAPRRRAYLRGLQAAAAGAVAAAAVVAGIVAVTPAVLDEQRASEAEARGFFEPVSPRKELQLRRQASATEGAGGPAIPV